MGDKLHFRGVKVKLLTEQAHFAGKCDQLSEREVNFMGEELNFKSKTSR